MTIKLLWQVLKSYSLSLYLLQLAQDTSESSIDKNCKLCWTFQEQRIEVQGDLTCADWNCDEGIQDWAS